MMLIAPLDAAFLISETREHPMHVGALLLFEQPDEAGSDFVGDLYRRLLTWDRVNPQFRRRPATPGPLIGAMRWYDDHDVDLDYHVRLSALPRPGRIRELLTLVSRLHGTLLDRHRPLWEFHLIEGLADSRFAFYFKVHHALVDGVNSTRQIAQMLSAEPTAPLPPPIWAERNPAGSPSSSLAVKPSIGRQLANAVGEIPSVLHSIGEAAALTPTLARLLADGLRSDDTALPFQAPKSMLNVPLSGARRFAAQSWSFQRMRAVGKAHGATLNDVLLAMCSGALRRYLLDADALPAESLVAAIPVALPVDRDTDGGNAVTMVLCTLATDIDDPHERLRRIHTSMLAAKNVMAGRSALQISLFGLATATGPTAANLLPGFAGRARPAFNLVISNVPGPRSTLYWDGARAVGWYPASIPTEGNAVNITVVSYADNIEFGLIGCRRSIPHLQRLLDDLEHSLRELESAPASSLPGRRPATATRRDM
jgi:diacylglycerol O-acyltransferase / wax synthase